MAHISVRTPCDMLWCNWCHKRVENGDNATVMIVSANGSYTVNVFHLDCSPDLSESELAENESDLELSDGEK